MGSDLFNDNLFADGGVSPAIATFTLSGLDAIFTYDLYPYSDFVNDHGGRFSIGGSQRSAEGGGNGAFIENTSYVLFEGLTPDANDELVGTLQAVGSNGDNSGTFSGLQLSVTAIPEASSFAACSLLALSLGLVRGWRRLRSSVVSRAK